MKYFKYHGLGNDYLVIRPEDVAGNLDESQIQCICHRNYGVGSDENKQDERSVYGGRRSQ
jgi:diaminopimelate epimerase